MDWLQLAQALAALLFVLGLIGLVSLLMRKYGQDTLINKSTNKPRLQIIESRTIDAKRRLMVLGCDDAEYVVMLNPNGDMLLETRTKKATKTATKKAKS